VLAAVDVGLLDPDLDPALDLRPLPVARTGLDDPGGAVDVQADPLAVEVQEDHADVGVLQQVAERGHDAVAPVRRVAHGPGVEDLDEAGRAGPERAVALAAAVGGGDPDHLLAADELDHALVQPLEHLLAVEAVGPVPRPHAPLERMLAGRAGERDLAVRRQGMVATHGPILSTRSAQC
jgi:hypothetical protein